MDKTTFVRIQLPLEYVREVLLAVYPRSILNGFLKVEALGSTVKALVKRVRHQHRLAGDSPGVIGRARQQNNENRREWNHHSKQPQVERHVALPKYPNS